MSLKLEAIFGTCEADRSMRAWLARSGHQKSVEHAVHLGDKAEVNLRQVVVPDCAASSWWRTEIVDKEQAQWFVDRRGEASTRERAVTWMTAVTAAELQPAGGGCGWAGGVPRWSDG
ncbi:hypothetical protein EYF80_040262 [Liparis tanakae]|uniref:Uncharacterized protein n=1 Tax=Liparis tanakae TaxID=230148 RepID=A0A4Z2G8E4_9TELE|nr:hypothetical protein EYF80_040262 [Liparis tanakae]